MKKRLAIFFFYDGQGIVDRYVKHYIESLHSVSEYIAVVCNGSVNAEGREFFENNTDFFYCRENTGLDTGAFKDALKTIGWDKIYEYDELIMANFTLFGPFYPLTEMFDEMDKRDVDYWGVLKVFEDPSRTTLYGRDVLPYHHVLDFTSSNFRVFRSSILHSFEFRSYWENLPKINDYTDSVLYGEMYFNKVFRDAGFEFDTYMSDDTRGACQSPNTNEMLRMVIKERVPFMRRKAWIEPYEWLLNFGYGEEPRLLLDYLDKETDYDVSMIYENLIRTSDPNALFYRLQQNYIIPENSRLSPSERKGRSAAVIYLRSPYGAQELSEYIDSFGKTDIYIAAGSSEVMESLENAAIAHKEARLCEDSSGELSALLLTFGDMVLGGGYDYICFAHDVKRVEGIRKAGQTHQDRNWTALFGSADVVENIIRTFENDPYLGLICPSPAYHGDEFMRTDDIWFKNRPQILKTAEMLGIDDSISLCPHAFETMFWFRPAALKMLFEREWESQELSEGFFIGLKLLMPYILKQNGFLFGCVLTDEQSKSELTSEKYMLGMMKRVICSRMKDTSSFLTAYRFLSELKLPKAAPSRDRSEAAKAQPDAPVQTARLYPDHGNGYCYQTSLNGGIVGSFGKYSHTFTLDRQAHRLRFDPANSTACLVRNAYAVSGGNTYQMAPMNGFAINGISYFMNSDPQMKIDTPYPMEGELTVNAEIVPLYDDIFYTVFENYKRDREKLERLEKKLMGRKVPDIKQIKYCPHEYGTGKMSAETGRQILYLDNGSGFRGMSPRTTPENKVGRDRLFIHEYFFNKEKLVRLRFDPSEKCGCIVYGMEVISNAGRLEIKRTNGFKLYDTFVFLTNDPQIEIAVPKGATLRKVRIKAFIVPIADSLVYQALSDCKTDLDRYERLRKLLKSEN